MFYIILLLAISFIGILMLKSGIKSIGNSMNEIKEMQKGKTTSEKATSHGCAILMMIVFLVIVYKLLF